MILTCPECATSYFVDDSRVPTAGRAVKCSHCGARWTARPEGLAEPARPASPAAGEAASPALPDVPAADELLVEEQEAEPAAPVARRRPLSTPEPRGGGKAMVWVASAAVAVGLVAGLLVFRDQVARLAPVTRPAFAGVGMPANPLGLVIENVRADPAFQGGRPVLAVTGRIRNVRDVAATAPSLKVSLLDRDGKPLATKLAQPIDGRVPAGQVRHFAIAIVDPPASVHDLEVTFDGSAKATAPVSPAPRAAAAVVAGSSPVEATALGPGAPEALPPR
jgi:predicted Zn finger-like uncharacterized protein